MSTQAKVIGTVLVFAIVGFLLNPQTPLGAAVFGAPAEEAPGDAPPPAWAVLALVGVGLVQALGFGAGFAFLLWGRPFLARLGAPAGLTTAAHATVVWSLVSWVPHTAMHMTAGPDLGKLVVAEVLFHVTLVLGAAVLALFLVRAGEARVPAAGVRPGPAAHVLGVVPAAPARPAAGQGPRGRP